MTVHFRTATNSFGLVLPTTRLHNYYNPSASTLIGLNQIHRHESPRRLKLVNFFKRDRTFREPIVKVTTLFMIAFHIGAVAALFMFTWKAFFVALVLWWVAGSL